MRLDLFLKKTRLVKQRSLAKQFCDAGAVHVNGEPAKPSQNLRAGDRIRLQLRQRCLEVRVLEIPLGNVPRGTSPAWFEILEERVSERNAQVFDGDPLPVDEADP